MNTIKYIVRSITYVAYHTVLERLLKRQQGLRQNKRVLVQINSGIGDSILALPMVHALSVAGYEAHALVNGSVRPVAKLCPDIRQYYMTDCKASHVRQVIRQIWTLKRLRFRYFIGALPSNLIRDAFLPVILGIPHRIKHRSPHKEEYREYDFLFNKLHDLEPNQSNVESNLSLLNLMDADIGIGVRRFNVRLSSDSMASTHQALIAADYCEGKTTIGIHAGCKEAWAFKRWPYEKFADLMGELGKRPNVQVLLFGGPDEVELCNRIAQRSSVAPVNLCGKLSLEGTMCAISLCKVFISNDSGLMHIATVFDVPVIGLFGSRSNEVATGPYGRKHAIIRKSEVGDITVAEVLQVALRLLGDL